jgi:hypothetical protein
VNNNQPIQLLFDRHHPKEIDTYQPIERRK